MLDRVSVRNVAVPRSPNRAGLLQTVIAERLLRLLKLKTRFEERINKLKQERDETLSRMEAELFARARAQEQFALQNRNSLFRSATSYELPQGGSLRLRESPLSVSYEELDDKTAVEALREAGAPEDCINNRPTVHKTNLKRALEDNPELQAKLEAKGFRFENGLMFTLSFSGMDAKIRHNAGRPDASFYIESPKTPEQQPMQAKKETASP